MQEIVKKITWTATNHTGREISIQKNGCCVYDEIEKEPSKFEIF